MLLIQQNQHYAVDDAKKYGVGLSNYVCIWIDDRKKVLSSVSDFRAPVVATRRA